MTFIKLTNYWFNINMHVSIISRRKALALLIVSYIRRDLVIWILFIVSILTPLVVLHAKFDGIKCDALCTILNNVSFGYAAGMIFYLFSDFRKQIRLRIKAVQSLAVFADHTEFLLWRKRLDLDIVDSNDRYPKDFVERGCKKLIINEINPGDRDHLTKVILQKDLVIDLKGFFSIIEENAKSILLQYSSALEMGEMRLLNELSDLYDKLNKTGHTNTNSGDFISYKNDVIFFLENIKILDDTIIKMHKGWEPFVYVDTFGWLKKLNALDGIE